MRKKQVMEQLAALRKKRQDEAARLSLLAAEGKEVNPDEVKALTAIGPEIEKLEAELKGIEDLEAIAKENAKENQKREDLAAAKKGVGAEVHDRAEDAPWRSFGEFLQAVHGAASQPSGTDPRLLKLAPLGANERVGADGGFLVGKDVSTELLQEMHDVAIIAPKCRPMPISAGSNALTINGVDETSRVDGSRWGGVQSYWADEAGTATATKPKFRQIELKLKKLLAFYYATDEVLADAAALEAAAQAAFAEEMAFKVDDAVVRGGGSGQPLGILGAGALVTVSKEVSQAAGTFLYENLIKMYARMPARSLARASFFINIDVMPQLMLMTMPGGTSATPVYLPPTGAAAAPFGTLLGRPIVPIEQCSSIGTVGDVIFADFSQYLLAEKGGLQQASSIHVQFLTGEQVFRFTYRTDGQPMRAKPLTPYKGANTLSPFVVLETR